MRVLILFCTAVLLLSQAASNGQVAYEEDVHVITNQILRQYHDIGDSMKGLQKQRNRTNDEMAEELMFVCNALAGNDELFSQRRYAFECLALFPSTNAIPFLVETFKWEDNACGYNAAVSYLRLSDYSEESIHIVEKWMKKNNEWKGALSVYSRLSSKLDYGHLEEDTRGGIVAFFERRAESDTRYADWLDRILCKHLPGYEKSDRRRETVEAVLANPSANSNAVQWAESTLSAMRQSQEKAVPPETADADTDVIVPANANEEASATDISGNEGVSAPEPRRSHRIRWAVMAVVFMAIVGIVGVHRHHVQ